MSILLLLSPIVCHGHLILAIIQEVKFRLDMSEAKWIMSLIFKCLQWRWNQIVKGTSIVAEGEMGATKPMLVNNLSFKV